VLVECSENLLAQPKDQSDRVFEKGGLEGIVGPHTEYAFYVELGTRFMSAQPFVRPALKAIEPEFIKDMARTLGGKK